ncbi:hypothetical protein DETS111669_28170 [Delftia tsuruhatensis]
MAFAAGAQCAIGQLAGAFIGFLIRVEDARRGALQLAGRALEHALQGLVGPQQPALAQAGDADEVVVHEQFLLAQQLGKPDARHALALLQQVEADRAQRDQCHAETRECPGAPGRCTPCGQVALCAQAREDGQGIAGQPLVGRDALHVVHHRGRDVPAAVPVAGQGMVVLAGDRRAANAGHRPRIGRRVAGHQQVLVRAQRNGAVGPEGLATKQRLEMRGRDHGIDDALEIPVPGLQPACHHDGPFVEGMADQRIGDHHAVGVARALEVAAVGHGKRGLFLVGRQQHLALGVGHAQRGDEGQQGTLLLQDFIEGEGRHIVAVQAPAAVAACHGGQCVVHQPHLSRQLQAQAAGLVLGDSHAQVQVGLVVGAQAQPGGQAQQAGDQQVAKHQAPQHLVRKKRLHGAGCPFPSGWMSVRVDGAAHF